MACTSMGSAESSCSQRVVTLLPRTLHDLSPSRKGECHASADNKLTCVQHETSLSSCNWCSRTLDKLLRHLLFCCDIPTTVDSFCFNKKFEIEITIGRLYLNALLSWYNITVAWTFYLYINFTRKSNIPNFVWVVCMHIYRCWSYN